MATNITSTHNELMCPVCLGIYATPRILACLHTLCEKCVILLINNERAIPKSDNKETFNCPVCRYESDSPPTNMDLSRWVRRLPLNTVIQEKVRSHSVVSEKGICTICKKSSPVKFCRNCDNFLCVRCLEEHKLSADYDSSCLLEVRINAYDDLLDNQSDNDDIGQIGDESKTTADGKEFSFKKLNQRAQDEDLETCDASKEQQSTCLVNEASEVVADEGNSSQGSRRVFLPLENFSSEEERDKYLNRQKSPPSHFDREYHLNIYRLRRLRTDFEERLRNCDVEVRDFMTQKVRITDEIKDLRMRIVASLDKLEDELTQQLETLQNEIMFKVRLIEKECQHASESIKRSENVLRIAKKNAREKELSETLEKIDSKFKDYERVLHRVRNRSNKVMMSVRIDRKVEEIMADPSKFIKLEGLGLNYRKRQSFKFVEIKAAIPNDSNSCDITDLVTLPSGKIIAADFRNEKLKLFDENFSFVSHLTLLARPFGVTAVNNTTLAVTLPEAEKVHLVTLSANRLRSIRAIEIGEKCWGISACGTELFVAIEQKNQENPFAICILGLEGNHIKIIRPLKDSLGKDVFYCPWYLTTSRDGKRIYLSDEVNHSVTCINRDGTRLFRYRDDSLENPKGITTDLAGNIFVCGYGSGNVHHISAEGSRLSVDLLHGCAVNRPCGLFCAIDGQKLFLTEESKSSFKAFDLKVWM
ncbi:hypothetical protein ACJMK2_041434 [Sinanodonta woodiana]|uniref:Uncharacterized protein n=1 Tax=Sinanodonta woodiana TaxID=1069815 RepID=A0ABD3W478_SINWO